MDGCGETGSAVLPQVPIIVIARFVGVGESDEDQSTVLVSCAYHMHGVEVAVGEVDVYLIPCMDVGNVLTVRRGKWRVPPLNCM